MPNYPGYYNYRQTAAAASPRKNVNSKPNSSYFPARTNNSFRASQQYPEHNRAQSPNLRSSSPYKSPARSPSPYANDRRMPEKSNYSPSKAWNTKAQEMLTRASKPMSGLEKARVYDQYEKQARANEARIADATNQEVNAQAKEIELERMRSTKEILENKAIISDDIRSEIQMIMGQLEQSDLQQENLKNTIKDLKLTNQSIKLQIQDVNDQHNFLKQELERAAVFEGNMEEKVKRANAISMDLLNKLSNSQGDDYYQPVKNDFFDTVLAEYINGHKYKEDLKEQFKRFAANQYYFGDDRIVMTLAESKLRTEIIVQTDEETLPIDTYVNRYVVDQNDEQRRLADIDRRKEEMKKKLEENDKNFVKNGGDLSKKTPPPDGKTYPPTNPPGKTPPPSAPGNTVPPAGKTPPPAAPPKVVPPTKPTAPPTAPSKVPPPGKVVPPTNTKTPPPANNKSILKK